MLAGNGSTRRRPPRNAPPARPGGATCRRRANAGIPPPAAPSRSTASRWPAGTPAARHAAAPPRNRHIGHHPQRAIGRDTQIGHPAAAERRRSSRPAASEPPSRRCAQASSPPPRARRGCAGEGDRAGPGQRARIDQLPAFPAGIGAAAAAESALPVEPQPPPARPTGPGLREARAPRRAGDAVPGRSCRAGGAPAARDHGRRPMPIRSHTASRPPRRYVSMSPPASPAPRPGWYSTCGRSGVLQVPPQVRPWSAAIWP